MPPSHGPLTLDERVRRVALLCVHFARNLAYYRAGSAEIALDKVGDFWRTAIGNFVDESVLEFCKLFGPDKEKHHWKRIVPDPHLFRSQLLVDLQISQQQWNKTVNDLAKLRNKFIAHLDSDRIMNIPDMALPLRMAGFYYQQLSAYCTAKTILRGLPTDLD